jgi:hypothetical protein
MAILQDQFHDRGYGTGQIQRKARRPLFPSSINESEEENKIKEYQMIPFLKERTRTVFKSSGENKKFPSHNSWKEQKNLFILSTYIFIKDFFCVEFFFYSF